LATETLKSRNALAQKRPGSTAAAEKERPRVLFLEQQGWRAGAERVLDEALAALESEVEAAVAFAEDGPFAVDLRRRGIKTARFPLGRYRSGPKSLADMFTYPFRSFHSAIRLAQFVRRHRVQMIYINSPRCLVAGLLAARLTGRPSLFHLHMTFTRRPDSLVAAWTAPHLTKIVACSETAAASLSSLRPGLKRAVEVIYNPVRKPISPSLAASPSSGISISLASATVPVVGVVGRITSQKGQHVLLHAAAELARFGRQVEIVFVGAPDENSTEDSSYAQELRILTERLGLRERVHWTGYLEDPNPIYALMDVLVIPSLVSEGLPLVALEALQWGVPVIGSQVGGVPEVVHDNVNGFLVPPGDFHTLAQNLGRLLDSVDLRARLQAGARDSVDHRFSPDTFRRAIRRAVFGLLSRPETIEPQTATVAQPCRRARSGAIGVTQS
jgi:glycosyltransferase involved in cell wall biosynthesis